MPVPLGPIKFVCPRCHWQRTIYVASDVFIRPEWSRHCQQCGCGQLEQVRGSHLASMLGNLAERLLRKLNK